MMDDVLYYILNNNIFFFFIKNTYFHLINLLYTDVKCYINTYFADACLAGDQIYIEVDKRCQSLLLFSAFAY